MADTEPGTPTSHLAHTRSEPDPETSAGNPDGSPALDETSATILAFERQWWRHAAAKEEAIRRQFRCSPTVYYQLLSRLIDDPAAYEAEPMLIRRLRRQRTVRRRQDTGTGISSARS